MRPFNFWKWISLDDVESMEPSLVSAIPRPVLQVLDDSQNSQACDDDDIYWKVDDTICKQENQPRTDNILLLWPKVIHIKQLLNKKKAGQKSFAEPHNIQLCTIPSPYGSPFWMLINQRHMILDAMNAAPRLVLGLIIGHI